jgi:hypothetical protein
MRKPGHHPAKPEQSLRGKRQRPRERKGIVALRRLAQTMPTDPHEF